LFNIKIVFKMKRLILVVLASFLLSGSGYAQIVSFPWTEDFEGGAIPSNWSQAYISGSTYWDVDGWVPHGGIYGAFFMGYYLDATKLITPQLDISGLTNPVLKFWHMEPYDYYYGMYQDVLNVYYKNSAAGAWILLGTYSNSTWTQTTIALPNASNNYYIAFEGVSDESEIDLDDIEVSGVANYVDVEVSSITAPTSGVNLTGNEQVKVLLKNNGSSITGFSLELRLNGSLLATETYSGTIAASGQAQYTFTKTVNLAAQGNYTISVTAVAANDQNAANNSKTVNVSNTVCSVISSFPWTEGFEGGVFPSCWLQTNVVGTKTWEIATSNPSVYQPHSGVYYALFANENYAVTTLTIPPLNLSALANPTLKFWHQQKNYYGDQDTLKIYYKNSSSGAWNLLAKYSNDISAWTQDSISLPNASSSYYIAFEGAAKYGYGIALDDITVFGVANYVDVEVSSITAPTSGVNLTNAEQVTVSLKNNGNAAVTGFSLELELNGSKIATETYSGSIAPSGQAQYTFTKTVNLSSAGNYTIKVTAVAANDQNAANNSKTINVSNVLDKVLEVVSYVPANNAADIELNSPVAVSFNQNITANDLSGITISPNVDGVSASVSDSVLSIAHDNFNAETTYTVSIPANAVNNYNQVITWQFTTKKNTKIAVYTENGIKIYPNPTSGQLTINNEQLTINCEDKGACPLVEVYNVVGQVVFTSQLSKLSPETTIDISHISAGLYFLKIDGKTVKIVKE